MKELLKMLKESERLNDVIVMETNNKLYITFEDTENDDDDRDFIDEDLVNQIINYLKTNAILTRDEMYKEYELDNIKIIVGYTSFDI